MYIGHIAGIVFLPISIIMYMNAFLITSIPNILGVDIRLIAAIGIVLIQIGDIIHSHFSDEHIILTWIAGLILVIPALLYFLSLAITIPAAVLNSLPLIMASFLFVEGLSSFFIGD